MRPTSRSAAWSATVIVHVILAAVLVSMTIPSFGNIAAQLQSGYLPPDYWLYPLLVLTTNALGAYTIVGLVRWYRGSRRTLVAIDFAVVLAAWSVLPIFAFTGDLPIVSWLLSPVALVLAWRGPMFDPDRPVDSVMG